MGLFYFIIYIFESLFSVSDDDGEYLLFTSMAFYSSV